MSWTDTVIWWHCYPLRFVGAEREGTDRVEHRLPRLIPWLDHIVDLGANGLLLAPIFASSTHGYDTLDHFRIDPRLGDDADADALIAAAHDRGVRVAFDGVFNHVARDHELVQRALAGGPDSDAGRWLRWEGEYPLVFEGVFDLIEIELNHPPVQDYVVEVMNHWLDRGIDGWRLDAAYAVGAEAWRPIIDRVKQAHPDCWIVGEVIHGDYAEFAATSGVDSVTEYELWKATWSSINDRNFHELAWTLQRHAEFTRTFAPQNFVGNHDVTRIATRITDQRDLGLAVALLLLLPGIPTIYAGDEHGFTGEKTDGTTGDDAVRPAFPATPAELSPIGLPTYHLHQQLIHLRRTHPWLATAELIVGDTTEQTIAIHLAGPEDRLTLALNVSDEEDEVAGTAGPITVPPHSWVLG